VIIAAELLKNADQLVKQQIHPTLVVEKSFASKKTIVFLCI
jgi:chaperonin GroEL (HSP60 family)